MVDILEQPEIRRIVSPISVEVYQSLDEHGPNGKRTELIRGIVLDKMGKTPAHVALLYRLFALVQMAAATAGLWVRKEDPLTLKDSEPEPDLAVVAGIVSDYGHRHPSTAHLVIEVAVTSLVLDRAKAPLYAEAGVSEYWIVLAQRGEVEAYTALSDGVYTQCRIYRQGESLLSTAIPALQVDLNALFAD